MVTSIRKKLIFTLFTITIGLLFFLILTYSGTTKTASAATTNTYRPYFDYEYSKGVISTSLVLDTSETNVTKSARLQGAELFYGELEFSLYGSNYINITENFPKGSTINSDVINIELTKIFDTHELKITNSSGAVVASSTSSKITATLTDGSYSVTYKGTSRWEIDGGIRNQTRHTQVIATFNFKVATHTHSYTATVTPATCTSGGYTTYKCSCGDSYTGNSTTAFGHDYKTTTTSASCTSGGYTTHKCSRCNNSYIDNQTSALGHSYLATTTESTCTSGGSTTYKCSRCNYSYVSNQTSELGHSLFVESIVTCTGEMLVYSCLRCNYSYTETNDTGGAGHSFSTQTTAATCTNGGYTIHTCDKCGYSYKDVISNALGHNYVATVYAPTCTQRGYTLYSCSRCEAEYTSGGTQQTGHSYVETTYPATCTEGSYTLHECSICGSSYKDNESQPLGHNFVTYTEPPTCTEYGKTVSSCQVCGYEESVSDGTFPMGHSYTSTVVKVATCTKDGVRRLTCDVCGEQYESAISSHGHHYEITKTHSSGGITSRTYTCSTCGDSYTQELGDQYEQVTSYVEYLFKQYSPYMIWVFLSTAGLWSIAIGVAIIIANKNEDKAKAKKMLVNYIIGLVIIAVILVACPYLVRGIAALVT